MSSCACRSQLRPYVRSSAAALLFVEFIVITVPRSDFLRMTKANCEVWTGVGLRSCWSSRTRGHFSKRPPHDDGQLSSERRTYVRFAAIALCAAAHSRAKTNHRRGTAHQGYIEFVPRAHFFKEKLSQIFKPSLKKTRQTICM